LVSANTGASFDAPFFMPKIVVVVCVAIFIFVANRWSIELYCGLVVTKRIKEIVMADQAQLSFTEKLSQYLHPAQIWETIKEHQALLIDACIYFGAGFLLGYFLKKYGQYVVAILLVSVGLIVLQQADMVTVSVNWAKIQSYVGIQQVHVPSGSSLLTVYWEWAKLNAVSLSSFGLGCLVGLKAA
jgi:uncharacterized membrane protein (Fun14 family)